MTQTPPSSSISIFTPHVIFLSVGILTDSIDYRETQKEIFANFTFGQNRKIIILGFSWV